MKTILRFLILLLALALATSAHAATIAVQSFTLPWNDSRTNLELWVFSNATWVDVDGGLHGAGSPSNKIFTQRVTGLSNNTSTHVLTIPAFNLTSTRDALQSPTVRLSFWVMSISGSAATPIKALPTTENGLTIPAEIASASGCSPSGTCATIAELVIYNQVLTPPLPTPSYYTKDQVDRLITASGTTFSLGTGSSGSDLNVTGTSPNFTINLPAASAIASGKVNTTTQTFAGNKTFAGTTAFAALSATAITGTTFNKVTITPPASGATLTIPNGVTLNAGAGGTLGSNAFTSTPFAPITSPTFLGTVTIPTPFTLGAVSVLPTGTELNYVQGVTSSIQTQINALNAAGYAPLASPTFTGTVTIPTPFTLGAVSVLPTGTELNFVDGVTSSIQTQLDAKLPKAGGTMTGNLLFTDNTLDIGAAGATRPRTGYFGTSLVSPSLATSAATPLLLTNGQLVNVALTAQTVGATTLTIPDFASVVDEFSFKTKAQTMSNKTFVAPVLGAATGTSLKLSSPSITVGSGTGITVDNTGELRRQVYKVTVTYLALAAANTVADATIATLPAKTRVLGIYADTTIRYAGGAVSACTLKVGTTVAGAELIAVHDVLTIAVLKGLADADMGSLMTRAAAIQAGTLPSWTATTIVSVRITTTTANTNILTQGSTTYYIITEMMP